MVKGALKPRCLCCLGVIGIHPCTTALQHHSTTALEHHSTTAPQHHSSAVLLMLALPGEGAGAVQHPQCCPRLMLALL